MSTDEQVDNLSLETQQERSVQYCVNHDWAVAKIFRDEGRSAKTTERPAFQQMLRFCNERRNGVGFVVVHDLSRFSRNSRDQLVIIEDLLKQGIQLRSVMENFDDSPAGRLMRTITGAFNQFENERKAERTKIGMQKSASMGRFPFKAPLGFINISAKAGHNLIPDPASAPHIKKAFELVAEGVRTKSEVLRRLSDGGLLTAKGNPLTPQTFQKILENPVYAGWVYIPSWDMKVRGSFEPLVSQELFDRVQDVLSGKRTAPKPHHRNHPDFPLRLFVRCANCHTPLTGSWSKGKTQRYPYYRCRVQSCKGVNVRAEELETKFSDLLEWLTPDPAVLSTMKEAVRVAWTRRRGDAEERFAKAKQRIAKANQRKDQLLDAMLDGKIDQATYSAQLTRFNAEDADAKAELRSTESEFIDLEGVLTFAEQIVSRPARLWRQSSLDQKQRLQTVLFPSGLEFDGESKRFGTQLTPSFFKALQEVSNDDYDMASPTGFEPVFSP